jgi:hypothetical protein
MMSTLARSQGKPTAGQATKRKQDRPISLREMSSWTVAAWMVLVTGFYLYTMLRSFL